MKSNELHEKIPEFAIEPTLISQGMFKLSSYGQKLMTMAMAFISIEKGNYTANFKTADFIKTMGLDLRQQSSETKKYIQAAAKECLKSTISIKKPSGEWVGYTWFTKSGLHKVNEHDGIWEEITMEFNPVLGEVIKELKRGFSQIDIPSLVKLQSKYAIRFFRLALSYSGFAGKDGNQPGQWYFEMTLEDIRVRFEIAQDEYSQTGNFRIRVIDEPIAEINAADVGLQIEPEYIRRGRFLVGIRFNCRWLKKKPAISATSTLDSKPEERDFISEYPEEFEELRNEFIENNKDEIDKTYISADATIYAVKKLEEKYATPEPVKEPPRKRGRPRKNPIPQP